MEGNGQLRFGSGLDTDVESFLEKGSFRAGSFSVWVVSSRAFLQGFLANSGSLRGKKKSGWGPGFEL